MYENAMINCICCRLCHYFVAATFANPWVSRYLYNCGSAMAPSFKLPLIGLPSLINTMVGSPYTCRDDCHE